MSLRPSSVSLVCRCRRCRRRDVGSGRVGGVGAVLVDVIDPC